MLDLSGGDLSPSFSVQTFQSGPISWFSIRLNYAGSFIGSVYPFQQNCNLPKLLVTFRNYSLNFLTVAFSSYVDLLCFFLAGNARRCKSAQVFVQP
jgi:hypothetical protein